MKAKFEKTPLFPFCFLLNPKSQSGNIAIVVALSMAVLLTMVAFVIDTGYLYGAKNKYQNGVEAAAMAGAVSLCDGDPEDVARRVAVANGLPADAVVAKTGFYDENDLYGDFPVYRDFVGEGTIDYPEDEFNNAVMVMLSADEETLMGGFVGKDEVTVGAAAVAYVKSYGVLSLGDDDNINVGFKRDGFPEFENCDMHSNNNISFAFEPDLNGSNVTAAGEITGCREGIWPVEAVSIKPVDWTGLRQKANENGAVLTYSDFEGFTRDNPNNINNGNKCYIAGANKLYFELKEGDHKGSAYYYDAAETPSNAKICIYQDHDQAISYSVTNFTFASEIKLELTKGGGGETHPILGSENEEIVSFFCKEKIIIRGGLNERIKGVIFRTENDLEFDFATVYSQNKYYVYARFTADGKIDFKRGFCFPKPEPEVFLFSTKFGPPCPATVVRLGKL